MTTPQRWQEIDRIFAAALEREPAARAAFLDEACAGDGLLRKEVESLLANDIPASLVGAAAVEEATRLLEKSAGELTAERIGRYRITRSLGAGGMGRIYLGLDEQLNRPVAVKLLSNYDASEAERMRRFRQEALAAAALNHPNIALIYNGLNEGDETLAWLERGYEQRDPRMVFLKVEPKWNNVRGDPRFQDLLRRVGF